MTEEEIDADLIEFFGEKILEDTTPEYRKQLYSFMEAVNHLANHKLNLEFNA